VKFWNLFKTVIQSNFYSMVNFGTKENCLGFDAVFLCRELPVVCQPISSISYGFGDKLCYWCSRMQLCYFISNWGLKGAKISKCYMTAACWQGNFMYIKSKCGCSILLEIVICWTHCILINCFVLLFQVLNMPSKYATFWNFGSL
jgi:hypothetical protein